MRKRTNRLKLFKFKHKFVRISIGSQTALAAEAHSAEGQWLQEQLNIEKLRVFRAGTRIPTVSRRSVTPDMQLNILKQKSTVAKGCKFTSYALKSIIIIIIIIAGRAFEGMKVCHRQTTFVSVLFLYMLRMYEPCLRM
jgi:hypothetical protein